MNFSYFDICWNDFFVFISSRSAQVKAQVNHLNTNKLIITGLLDELVLLELCKLHKKLQNCRLNDFTFQLAQQIYSHVRKTHRRIVVVCYVNSEEVDIYLNQKDNNVV